MAKAKKEPKNQHIIPRCYLKQFTDPNTPVGQEPYVWIFERNSRKGKKKAPANILTETDFYTFRGDYTIEKTLAQIESDYSTIFDQKIKNRLPLDPEEHLIFCAFVAAMIQRTLKQKENIESFMDQIIGRVKDMETAHKIPPKASKDLEEQKKDAHKLSVMQMIPEVTKILCKMNLAFLCANRRSAFITSDAPAFLFNSQLQFQRFYGPGLNQKHVEVRLPLSPEISAIFSWVNNLRGFIELPEDKVHESNRMTLGYAHEYFIANSPKLKRRWFRRFPLDPVLIWRFLKNQYQMKLARWRRRKYHVRKR